MPGKFYSQAEIFFRKANADLKLAKYAFEVKDDELDVEIVFFHLQQAAEKYIKALLSHHGVHFGKIHDIERLISVCEENGVELPEYTREFIELNPYAVEGRYAMICDELSDAGKYIDLLELFKDVAASFLGGGPTGNG